MDSIVTEQNTRESNYYETKDMKNQLCTTAMKVVKKPGKCTELCPFASCIMDLKPASHRLLINTKKILNALDMISKGFTMADASRSTGLPEASIKNYKENADHVYEVLLGYGIVKDLGI